MYADHSLYDVCVLSVTLADWLVHFVNICVFLGKVSDAGVCELARMCPLEEVVLSGVSGLTDRSVFALANCCASTLKEIYASGCSMITQAAINYLKVIISDLFVKP